MTEHRAVSIRMSEVLRLITALSDQILDAQIMKHPIPDAQIMALAKAALLLQDHAIPLPPLAMQVLHEISAAGLAAAVVEDKPQRPDGLVIDTVVSLTLRKWETVSGQFAGSHGPTPDSAQNGRDAP